MKDTDRITELHREYLAASNVGDPDRCEEIRNQLDKMQEELVMSMRKKLIAEAVLHSKVMREGIFIHVDQIVKSDFTFDNPELSEYWDECLELKNRIIGDEDHPCLSLAKLVYEPNQFTVAGHLDNLSIEGEEYLESGKYVEEFPLHAKKIREQLDIGKNTQDSLNICEEFLQLWSIGIHETRLAPEARERMSMLSWCPSVTAKLPNKKSATSQQQNLFELAKRRISTLLLTTTPLFTHVTIESAMSTNPLNTLTEPLSNILTNIEVADLAEAVSCGRS